MTFIVHIRFRICQLHFAVFSRVSRNAICFKLINKEIRILLYSMKKKAQDVVLKE